MQFNTQPGDQHFQAVQQLLVYLLITLYQELTYWRPTPLQSLPRVPHDIFEVDYNAPKNPFPAIFTYLFTLSGYVDASHATACRMHSVTGFHFLLGENLVAYKTKVQSVVSISSTEAELIAACFAAKMALYLQAVLLQLGFPQTKPTKIFKDNKATIAIVNEGRPSPRTRHIKIQTFTVQSWCMTKQIRLQKIHGTANQADGGKKALGFVNFTRHYCHVNDAHSLAKFATTSRPKGIPSSYTQIVPGLN